MSVAVYAYKAAGAPRYSSSMALWSGRVLLCIRYQALSWCYRRPRVCAPAPLAVNRQLLSRCPPCGAAPLDEPPSHLCKRERRSRVDHACCNLGARCCGFGLRAAGGRRSLEVYRQIALLQVISQDSRSCMRLTLYNPRLQCVPNFTPVAVSLLLGSSDQPHGSLLTLFASGM